MYGFQRVLRRTCWLGSRSKSKSVFLSGSDYSSPRDQTKWKSWKLDRFKAKDVNATKKLKGNDGESSSSPFSTLTGTPVDTPSENVTADEGDEGTKTVRPMGRKTFKKMQKGEKSKEPKIMVELLEKLQESAMLEHSKYQVLEEQKVAAAKDYYAKMEQTALKAMELKEREQAIKERKALIKEREQEDRIMAINMNDPSLNDIQRQYYRTMQEKIMLKRCNE